MPNSRPPAGRATNPTPKLANDARNALFGSIVGKNSAGRTVAEMAP